MTGRDGPKYCILAYKHIEYIVLLDMERTTIYLDNSIKRCLLELSSEKSKKKGKRVGMAGMIRDALVEYLKKRGKSIEDSQSVIEKMLATRGTLGEDFEDRVHEVQHEMKKGRL